MEKLAELRRLLNSLFASQRLAVLATQLNRQPYGNLVAFAETGDLKSILFVTSRNTRKYSNIKANEKVTILVDNRTNRISDLNTAIAVTALGEAKEVAANQRNRLAEVYTSKHPHLADFISRPSNALMKIAVDDYIIASFDKVHVLHMGR